MPHDLNTHTDKVYKKGDRVQNRHNGDYGTIYQDQTAAANVHLNWDKYPGQIECMAVQDIQVAPWHEVPDPRFTSAGSIIDGKVTETDLTKGMYQIGDRVKLKYNRSCGTIATNQFPGDTNILVKWDKADKTNWEHIRDLVTLYAPRDDDPANPNQAGIDAIEGLRQELIKEVEALQSRLRTLTQAKRLLERG
jgi:hypothetical protein